MTVDLAALGFLRKLLTNTILEINNFLIIHKKANSIELAFSFFDIYKLSILDINEATASSGVAQEVINRIAE